MTLPYRGLDHTRAVQPSLQPSLGVHAEERPRAFSCVVHAIMRWEAEAIPAGRRQAVETEASAIWGRLGIDLRWGSDPPERGAIIVSVVVTDRVQRLGRGFDLERRKTTGTEKSLQHGDHEDHGDDLSGGREEGRIFYRGLLARRPRAGVRAGPRGENRKHV